jgi:hypothetical protein
LADLAADFIGFRPKCKQTLVRDTTLLPQHTYQVHSRITTPELPTALIYPSITSIAMAGLPRPANGPPAKKTSMRPPPRPNAPTPTGRAPSPADSTSSHKSMSIPRSPSVQPTGGVKRKEREYDSDGSQETNLHVVVRCRGRNDREVRENSGVVVSTEGAKGRTVELSMGPSALSNKTYHFDKVFSPAADQAIIFDDVVKPFLDEVCQPKDLPSEANCLTVLDVARL